MKKVTNNKDFKRAIKESNKGDIIVFDERKPNKKKLNAVEYLEKCMKKSLNKKMKDKEISCETVDDILALEMREDLESED